jgi:initiation factor 1A
VGQIKKEFICLKKMASRGGKGNGGGKRNKSAKKGGNDDGDKSFTPTLKDVDQEYGVIKATTGDSYVTVLCFDGKERRGKIRGKFRGGRGGNWMNVGTLVLVGLRGFQDKTCDIIDKYSPEAVKMLKKMGELPDASSNDSIDKNDHLANLLKEDERKMKIAEDVFDFESL